MSTTRKSKEKRKRGGNSVVIQNPFFVVKEGPSGTEKKTSYQGGQGDDSGGGGGGGAGGNTEKIKFNNLNYLQDVFKAKLDPDVVHMVFTESECNVDKSLESLFTLAQASESTSASAAATSSVSCSTSSLTNPTTLTVNANSALNCKQSTSVKTKMEQVNKEKDYVNAVKSTTASVVVNNQLNQRQQQQFKLQPNAQQFVPASFKQTTTVTNATTTTTSASVVNEVSAAIKNNAKLLVIMRGLPGSGKSTLANKLVRYTNGVVHSTDDYFASKNNVYHYDWTRLDDAHAWNQKRTLEALRKKISPIFVDNTNLEAWEMKPYVKMGYENGYRIYFLEPETSWRYKITNLVRFNKHGIGREKLERMAEKFDKRVTVVDVINSIKNEKQRHPNQSVSTTQANDAHHHAPPCGQSTNPKEPSPKIGLDLLMILNNKNGVPESDTSSVNTSDAASCGSKEGFWEKDEDFTFSTNLSAKTEASATTAQVVDVVDSCPVAVELTNDEPAVFEPKPQRDRTKCKGNEEASGFWSTNTDDDLWEDEKATSTLHFLPESPQPSPDGQDEQQGDNRSIRKVISSLKKKGDWSFPAFPDDHSNSPVTSDESSRFIYYKCNGSQTETRDWALLEAKQSDYSDGDDIGEVFHDNNNIHSTNLQSFSSSGEDVIAVPSNRTLRGFRVDRGSSTGDLPGYVSFDEKLSHLQKHFPMAHYGHLREVLDACHEDYQWAFNLLSEFSEEHFSEVVTTGATELERNAESSVEESPFILKLDPTFCAQLESLFGTVTDNLTEEQMSINVSHGVAKLLHHCWKLTVQQQEQKQKPNLADSVGSKTSRSQLCEKSLPKPTESSQRSLLNEAPKSHLKEIMDLEMALNLSWNEYYSTSESNKELLSTKLKREQLYRTYPGLDRQVLDELFESNQFRISDTIATIDQSLGVSASLTPATEVWVTAEAVDRGQRVRSAPPQPTTYSTVAQTDVQEPSSPVKPDASNEFSGLRTKILEYHRKRRECQEKARTAYQGKQYAVASFYSGQAREYQLQIDDLSKQLVKDVLSANKSRNLDLHGMHSSEVLIAVSSFLSLKIEELKRSRLNRLHVDIITGWGAHSNLAPKIKPIVINYLQSKKYKFEVINPGVIRVTVS